MDKKMQRLKRTSHMLGCEVHNYVLIKQGITMSTYKCSKCRDVLRLDNNNPCCECIKKCKGQVQGKIDKDKGIYKKCNGFLKVKED